MADEIILYWDDRRPVRVDREEFCLIRMMLEECGGDESMPEAIKVICALMDQGYKNLRARELVILARTQWREEWRS